MSGLSLDEVGLVGDPLLLDLDHLLFELLDLLVNVILLGLHGSGVLVDTCVLELSPYSVELVDLELSLVNSVVSLLDVLLELFDFVLLFFELGDEVIQFLLEEVVLLHTVEVVDSDSGDFVGKVFDLDFFLGNVLINIFSLFKEVG